MSTTYLIKGPVQRVTDGNGDIATVMRPLKSQKGWSSARMDTRESLFSFYQHNHRCHRCVLSVSVKNPAERRSLSRAFVYVCFLLFFSVGVGNLPLALPGCSKACALAHFVWFKLNASGKEKRHQKGGTCGFVRWRETHPGTESSTEIEPVCVCGRILWMLASLGLFIRVFPLLLSWQT